MVLRHVVDVRRSPARVDRLEHVVTLDGVDVAPVPVQRRGVGKAHRAAGPRVVLGLHLRTEVIDDRELEDVPGIDPKCRAGEGRVVGPDDEGHAVGEGHSGGLDDERGLEPAAAGAHGGGLPKETDGGLGGLRGHRDGRGRTVRSPAAGDAVDDARPRKPDGEGDRQEQGGRDEPGGEEALLPRRRVRVIGLLTQSEPAEQGKSLAVRIRCHLAEFQLRGQVAEQLQKIASTSVAEQFATTRAYSSLVLPPGLPGLETVGGTDSERRLIPQPAARPRQPKHTSTAAEAARCDTTPKSDEEEADSVDSDEGADADSGGGDGRGKATSSVVGIPSFAFGASFLSAVATPTANDDNAAGGFKFDTSARGLAAAAAAVVAEGGEAGDKSPLFGSTLDLRRRRPNWNKRMQWTGSPTADNDAASLALIKKRVDAKDPDAIEFLATSYFDGDLGLQKDVPRAIELWTEAANYGDLTAQFVLGTMYLTGVGVDQDSDISILLWQHSAIDGHPASRFELGHYENDNGNHELAVQHWIISAKLGYEESLEMINVMFKKGHATKAQYAEALRGYQNALEETKSAQREEADALFIRKSTCNVQQQY
ncbi:hypothetical protein THAOC_26451 [Thalassiosira oceanica]|uniref:Uncharacterized protein n=1 Tax=Thalassiosira oceanica TaxID=159749 RepID=K0RJV7_THAOC|nr:hypothetical protein THAOC_26451 [Thalassiosira oceanica]|eukprot:EJK54003.1 hypothetical protein THAOC_26451 [Thalassiosira oceanica]